jgi:SIR2-like domain
VSASETMRLLLEHLGQFRDDKASPDKPLFWLGAGCSVHDGVPLNDELLRLALPNAPGAWGSPQFRFDRFCNSIGPGLKRASYLDKHLRRTIKADSPYHGLVQLLAKGYADLVFTFNIDDLMEQALRGAGLIEHSDYTVIKVPEMLPEAAVLQIGRPGGARIRLVKLHGDYELGLNYMTSSEITRYGEQIKSLVRDFSSRAAIVCGYSFFHLNVLDAFSRQGGPLFYANSRFPDAPMVLSLMAARNPREALFVDGPEGTFSPFIDTLLNELP